MLVRFGLVFFDDASEGPTLLPEALQHAVELELAALGYVPSTRLTARMRGLSLDALMALRTWLWKTLAESAGGGVAHTPLFRSFPDGIPTDTRALWWRKVLSCFMEHEQACLFCGLVGTTHVLSPCGDVVCDQCFDGRSYSACPVCEQPVDRDSPFFQPTAERTPGDEVVRLRRLDLGPDLDAAARALLEGYCARTQALTPGDAAALTSLVRDLGTRLLPWLPEQIPLRENVARIFGVLLQVNDPDLVMAHARRYLKTATDLLRLIAVYSDADPALQPKQHITLIAEPTHASLQLRFPGSFGAAFARRETLPHTLPVETRTERFIVRPIPRPLRRMLLEWLETLPPDTLAEDMLRHRSAWEWLGRFLHPHEHARRLPAVARAFAIVRGRDPQGRPAPAFQTSAGRVEAALAARDVDGALALLADRPGQLARRFDHLLRAAGEDHAATSRVVATFARHAPQLATPLLATLRAGLGTRQAPAPVRVYWPKGTTTTGVAAVDVRPPLSADVIGEATRVIDDALLTRFAKLPAYDVAILDDALRAIVVPFNERTASRAKVALPRGSRVPLGALDVRTLRLFLHWCEPERGGNTTDIDLSVAFFDATWVLLGQCSWSQLTFEVGSEVVARSAGDLRGAPFPDGASEFVDIDLGAARRAQIRYAVMLVNNYRGMAFGALERGFAGTMLRDDTHGLHFDPRTVQQRFDLTGEHGIYVPLVVDLTADDLHWLDVYSPGKAALNTVESGEDSVSQVCQDLLAYFGSGARPSMFTLAALHAAARTRRVIVRADDGQRVFTRREGEAITTFAQRLIAGHDADPGTSQPTTNTPVFAALYRGDLELAADSTCYALLPEVAGPTIAASDLLAS